MTGKYFLTEWDFHHAFVYQSFLYKTSTTLVRYSRYTLIDGYALCSPLNQAPVSVLMNADRNEVSEMWKYLSAFKASCLYVRRKPEGTIDEHAAA